MSASKWLMSLTREEYVVTGYLREHEQEHNISIPDEVQFELVLFYPILLKYQGMFKKRWGGSNPFQDYISSNGYKTHKLDIPLPVSLKIDPEKENTNNVRYG